MGVNEFAEPIELDRLREMVNANIIILRVNTKGEIVYINKYARQFFGYDKNELLGKPVIGTILSKKDSYGHDLEHLLTDVIHDPVRYHKQEHENRLKNGARVWIAWTNKAIYNDIGKLVEILSIGIDITDRVKAEQDLKNSRDELERRVIERTAEIQDINTALRNENEQRRKTEKHLLDSRAQAQLYLDLISHDINNMNQISLGYLEMAVDTIKEKGKLEGDNSPLIEKPMESLRNCSRLIQTVKALQNMDTSNLPMYVVDLGRMLGELKDESTSVPGRDVKINLPAVMCNIRANDLLKDAFRNILGNAIKHSEGPLSIWINTSPVHENGTDFCRVTIEDNGPGISKERKSEMFKRLSSEDKTPGKGLGLYLVGSLVKKFNGRVWVEDRIPGDHKQGTRFVLMLPAAHI